MVYKTLMYSKRNYITEVSCTNEAIELSSIRLRLDEKYQM